MPTSKKPVKRSSEILPKPDCYYGYTPGQIKEIMGRRIKEFNHYMRGQTMAICETTSGRCRKAHGLITYRVDVERFLLGLSTLD